MKVILAPENIQAFKFEANTVWAYLFDGRKKYSLVIETEIAPCLTNPSGDMFIALDMIGEDIFKQWSKYLADPEHIIHKFLKCVRESRKSFCAEPEYFDEEGNLIKEKTDKCENRFLYCRYQSDVEKIKNIDLLHHICTDKEDNNDASLMCGTWKVVETTLIAGREELFIKIQQII